MKAYKKLQTRYHEKVKAKWRAKIKCAVCSVLIMFLVACFIGLVIGLSLGLERHTQCRKDYESFCGHCTDVRSDPLNCGECGHVCDVEVGAACVKKHCEFCTFNCSADNDFCTVEPCNSTAGCSIFDCDNDGNPCTMSPCKSTGNATANGCTPVDCAADGDYCTVGTCDPGAGGCPTRDCDSLGDPCLTNPCSNGACSNQCPKLLLNNPSINYSQTFSTATNISPFATGKLLLSSVPNIDTITITYDNTLGSDTLNTTGFDANIANTFSGQTLTLSAIPSNGVPASSFLPLLNLVRYSATPSVGPHTVAFTYTVLNKKPRSLPSAVVATLTFNI